MATFDYEVAYSAVGDGIHALVHATVMMATPTVLTTTESVFNSGRDTGKAIAVNKMHQGSNLVTIVTVNSATQIVVSAPMSFTASGGGSPIDLVGVELMLMWGTDNTARMNAFVAANPTGTHTLTLTSGHKYYHSYLNPAFGGTTYTQLTLQGNAVSRPTMMLGTGHWGTSGQYQDLTHSARTQNVAVGQNYVTLKNTAKLSLFTVGNWGLMTGGCLQLSSYPTNHQVFQFNRITAVDTASGSPTYGRVTFADAFLDEYLDEWVSWDLSGSTIDDGGPATLYAMPQTWNAEFIYQDIIFVNAQQQSSCGRISHFINCDSVTVPFDIGGLYPTFCHEWIVEDGDWGDAVMEMDKYVTTATFDGVTINNMHTQSVPIRRINLIDCDVATIQGTARTFYMDGTTVSGEMLICLAGGYGQTEEVELYNSSIATLTPSFNPPWTSGFLSTYINLVPGAGFNGSGQFIIPKTTGPVNWAHPGNVVCFFEEDTVMPLPFFRVVRVQEDGPASSNNMIVTTNPPIYAWPVQPFGTPPAHFGIFRHPCRKFTARNCTGDKIFEGLNVAPARAPIGTYHKATYLSSAGTASQRIPYIVGDLARATFEVTHAYASGALTLDTIGSTYAIKSNGLFTAFYEPQLDCTRTATRVVTKAGTTGTGGTDSGFAIPDAVQTWLIGTSPPNFMTNVSGTDPLVSVTVTVETNQGPGRRFVCNFT